MLGTIVNSLTIIAGSLVGLFFKKGIPEKYNQTIMQAMGLCVLLIGVKGALGSDDLLETFARLPQFFRVGSAPVSIFCQILSFYLSKNHISY